MRDPLLYIDGNSLYEYVRSNPGNYIDSAGLECKETIVLHVRWAYDPAQSQHNFSKISDPIERKRLQDEYYLELRNNVINMYRKSRDQLKYLINFCCRDLNVKEACDVCVESDFKLKPYTDVDSSLPVGIHVDRTLRELRQTGIVVIISGNINQPQQKEMQDAAGIDRESGISIYSCGVNGRVLSHELGHHAGYLPQNDEVGVNKYHHKDKDNLMYHKDNIERMPDRQWCEKVVTLSR